MKKLLSLLTTTAVLWLFAVTPAGPINEKLLALGPAMDQGEFLVSFPAPQKAIQKKPLQKQPIIRGRGYKLPAPEVLAKLHADAFKRHGHRMHMHVKAMTAPATFDSRTMGWIPPIRDQGSCGDCFGVEASDALSIAFIKAGYQKADGSFVISEQAGLDCGYYEGGCNGGDGPQVYGVMKSKGFPAEKYLDATGKSINDYPPYTASAGQCRTASGAKMWKCADWGYVTSDQSQRAPTVDEVKAGILNYGTVTFAFDASALDSYSGTPIQRLGNSIDHEITGFIGWDDGKKAFICRNQWGPGFGDVGYFWLSYSALPAIVEACFLTATVLPPPPPPPAPPPPPGGGTPPFCLYEGQAPNYKLVGKALGYTTILTAEQDAKSIANADAISVGIWDSAKPSVLIETVQPGVIPPTPGGPVAIMLDPLNKYLLTPEQVASVLTQAGIADIIAELLKRLKTNKEPPLAVPSPSPAQETFYGNCYSRHVGNQPVYHLSGLPQDFRGLASTRLERSAGRRHQIVHRPWFTAAIRAGTCDQATCEHADRPVP